MEWFDFQTRWEQRLLDVALPFLDPAPAPVEGSGMATWQDESCLVAIVTPGEESPPRSGYFDCVIGVIYDYRKSQDPEEVSRTWGQILKAFGDGENGDSELRTRLASGDLVIPGGIGAVRYTSNFEHDEDAGAYTFQFSAHLGIQAPDGT